MKNRIKTFLYAALVIALGCGNTLAGTNGAGIGGATPPPGGGASVLATTIFTDAFCTGGTSNANAKACGSFLGYSNPKWYNATGLNNHDDGPAIDSAATDACSGGWKRVGFSWGTYLTLRQHDAKCHGETFFALPQNAAYDGTNIHAAVTIHFNDGFVAGMVTANKCAYNQNGFVDQVIDGINWQADGGQLGHVNFCNSHNTVGGEQTPRIYLRNGSTSLFGAVVGDALDVNAANTGFPVPYTGTGNTRVNLITVRMENWKGEENALGIGTGNLTDLYADFRSEFAGNACGIMVAGISGVEGVVIKAFRSEENGYSGIANICGSGNPAYQVTGRYWEIDTQFQNNYGADVWFSDDCGMDSIKGGFSADGGKGAQGAQSTIVFNASCQRTISLNGFYGSVYATFGQTAPKYFIENLQGDNKIGMFGGNLDPTQYTISDTHVVSGTLDFSPVFAAGYVKTFINAVTASWAYKNLGGI